VTLVATLAGIQTSILINLQTPPTIGLPPAMTVISGAPDIGMKLLNNCTDTFGVWVDETMPTPSVVLSRWNGTTWMVLGNCPSTSIIDNFDSVLVNGLPFIGYTADENPPTPNTRNIRFYQWSGTQMVLAPSPLRNSGTDSGQISLATTGSSVYATWQENSSGLPTYASVWNGISWTPLGGQINATGSSYYPQIAVFQGNPLVMTDEGSNMYLKQWNGGNWNTLLGPVAYGTGSGLTPQLRVFNDTIYTAWLDWNSSAGTYKVYVGQSDGTMFSILGNTYVNVNPTTNTTAVALEVFGGTPYVGYTVQGASPTQVYAQYFSGGVWNLVSGTSLNVNPTENAYGPLFSNINGVKYAAISETPGSFISSPSSINLIIMP